MYLDNLSYRTVLKNLFRRRKLLMNQSRILQYLLSWEVDRIVIDRNEMSSSSWVILYLN